MKRSIEETAARFDELSEEYDDTRPSDTRETASRVVERAAAGLSGDEVVVDIGTGTGAVALPLAEQVEHVYALDVSDGMRDRAREKAAANGIETVSFGYGTFREPASELEVPAGDVDLVVSSFAMHHLNDAEKADAIATIRDLLTPRGRFVLGDVIVFDEADVSTEYYSPEVDDPATVDYLVDCFEDCGFDVETERVGPMAGVLDGTLA